jgi:hypothetical protein
MIAKGKIIDIIQVTEAVTQIVIMNKKDESYYPICFTAYQDITILCKQIKLDKGDLVKIDYFLKSKKYQEKYFTSAIIEKLQITQKKTTQLSVDMETGEIY